MPDRPLLLFPRPGIASRSSLHGGLNKVHRPSHQQQVERLSPKFSQLQKDFNERKVEIQQTTAGIDPEQVLVIETIGSIENFAKAVKKIAGCEWMGEIEIDEISPDQDFFVKGDDPEKELSGRLYLIMTNQQALDQILSLWRRYKKDQNIKFERGLAKFKDVFRWLKDIHRWGVQDRLFETGVLDIWREDLENDGERPVRCETELWFSSNQAKRQAGENQISDLVMQLGGRILSQSVIEGIAYHGLLMELPANAIRSIVDDPNTELVNCENIMFFRSVGQITAGDKTPEGEVEIANIGEMTFPAGEPVIALLDGMPLANHRLLAGRLRIDDPDGWESDYAASERVHGTAMASLIIHGDLNEGLQPQPRPIYVRPIMKPMTNDLQSPRREYVPDDMLTVDLVHRSVKRIIEGENNENPAAPQVRIFNISIGDPARQFSQIISPIARLLDWLSFKYSILFVISAGNHVSPISLEMSQTDFKSLQPNELESAMIKAIYRDARKRKLLAPAESINGLTIGAAHVDSSQVNVPGRRFDPIEGILPSPVSAFGSGYRRAIKPDLIYTGGRQWYQLPIVRDTGLITIEPAIFRSPPGNKVASPGSHAGELTAASYSCGTSNAAALISRAAGICYDSLQQIFTEQASEIDPRSYEVPLLKAMLVHGCWWGEIGDRISEVLRTPKNDSKLKGLVSKWLGYGIPEINRVLDCTGQRATLLGFGRLSDGEAHVFHLPLPPSLGSRSEWRRLTVTLAWLSPISAKTQKYRTASLWFEVKGMPVAKDRKDVCGGKDGWRAVRRGTVQHEIFEGQRAEPFGEENFIEIKVNCREDAAKIKSPIAYGIVVSLEIREGVDIAIYDEIRIRIAPEFDRIAPPIQILQSTDNDQG